MGFGVLGQASVTANFIEIGPFEREFPAKLAVKFAAGTSSALSMSRKPMLSLMSRKGKIGIGPAI